MRIVIAPDKFKGSLEAPEVAAALAEGVRRSLGADTAPEIITVPMADGGEGTVAAALAAGYTEQRLTVSGPTGRPVVAGFAVSDPIPNDPNPNDKGPIVEAVVELATASGIGVLPHPDGRAALAPLESSSTGTGELIRAALDAGASRIVLGVGGSACTDGGAGLLTALGVRLLDHRGRELFPGGAALADLARVDLSELDPRLARTEFVLAADVDHPLVGDRGAAAVFGPQKGATGAEVVMLDDALAHWRDTLAASYGRGAPSETIITAASAAGAGAAGGVGFAAIAVLGATRRPGVEVVLELTGLPQIISGPPTATLVVTGEGSLDEQSLGGKSPMGVARAAAAAGVPVLAVCGRTTLEGQQIEAAGFIAVLALTNIEHDLELCMTNTAELLQQVGESIGREFVARVTGDKETR